jgi:hypothetical protein
MFAAASTTTTTADESTTSTTTVTTADGLSIYARDGKTQQPQPQPQLQANVVLLWTRMLLVTPVPSQRFQMKRTREQADAVEREKEGNDKAAVACWEKQTFLAQGVDEDANALHFQLRSATFACVLSLVFFCDDDDCVMSLSS